MSYFDTFLFDEDLYDDPGVIVGKLHAVIIDRKDFRAAIIPGSMVPESAPVANTE